MKDEHATAVWQARNESFRDNWGSHALTFAEFSYYCFDNPEYDPTLWTVIWADKEVAGFSINHYRMDIGWIHMLGVRPAWRKKGLGLALLHHSFGEFYRRGMKTIGLGVDASNATGATRLYQKAGMRTVSQFVTFEKELRAGKTESERAVDRDDSGQRPSAADAHPGQHLRDQTQTKEQSHAGKVTALILVDQHV